MVFKLRVKKKRPVMKRMYLYFFPSVNHSMSTTQITQQLKLIV